MTPRRLALLAVVLFASACQQALAIWLGPGASVDRPVFLLGTRVGEVEAVRFTLLRVDPCEALDYGRYPPQEEATWFVTAAGDAGPISEVVYGAVPPGYEQFEPAAPLEVGQCYSVTLGTEALEFEVQPSGLLRATAAMAFTLAAEPGRPASQARP